MPLPSPILHANYSTKIFKAHPILTEQVLGPGILLSLAGKLLIIIQLSSVAGKCIDGSVQGNWCVGESRKPLEEMTFSLIIKGKQAITVGRKLVGMSPTSTLLIQGKRDARIGQVHKHSLGGGASDCEQKNRVYGRSKSGDDSCLFLLSQTFKVRWGLGLFPINKEVHFLPLPAPFSLEC